MVACFSFLCFFFVVSVRVRVCGDFVLFFGALLSVAVSVLCVCVFFVVFVFVLCVCRLVCFSIVFYYYYYCA